MNAIFTLGNIIGAILLTIVLVTAKIYWFEYRQDREEYYTYLGVVPEKSKYVFPEKITLFPFGTSPQPVDLKFTRNLVCTEGDDQILLSTQFDFIKEFEFKNTIPTKLIRLRAEGLDASSLGVLDNEDIRKNATLRGYRTVDMGEDRPLVTSTCHIDVVVVHNTPIFKLPRKTTFTSTDFLYTYPTPENK